MTQRSCISRGLAKYFGDNSEGLPSECGHCSWCETHTPVVSTPREVVSGEHAQVSKILDNVHERDDPRFLARIAFGIKSPRISASRYDKNGYFGSLKQHDFQVSLRSFFQTTLLTKARHCFASSPQYARMHRPQLRQRKLLRRLASNSTARQRLRRKLADQGRTRTRALGRRTQRQIRGQRRAWARTLQNMAMARFHRHMARAKEEAETSRLLHGDQLV